MLLDSFTPVWRLPANEHGRDFVAGDLHGAFQLLSEALAAVSFDESKDRLFLVGDLVDRGPHSWECLQLLAKPWVFCARGNHEQMALDVMRSDGSLPTEPATLRWMSTNGLDWWQAVPQVQRLQALRKLARLPLAIELATPRGTAGFIHAEVPPGMAWPHFISALERLDEAAVASCLWGRRRAERSDCSGVAGVGRVYVGHTPQWSGMRRFGNVYAVDTGAVFGQQGAHPKGKLSLANVLTRTATLGRPEQLRLIDVANDPVLDSPFGQGPAYITHLANTARRPTLFGR